MPLQFVSLLAELLDQLAAANDAVVGETPELVSVAGLSSDAAQRICDLIGGAWRVSLEDSAGNPTQREHLAEAFSPFRLVIAKPPAIEGALTLLTLAGFRQAFTRQDLAPIVRHARSTYPFETRAFRVTGWDDETADFTASDPLRSPRELVRETAQARIVPADLRPWLHDGSVKDGGDVVYRAWAQLAVQQLARSLATEVLPDGQLIFRGIVRLQINAPDGFTLDHLGPGGFHALQQAAGWVYENAREAETRLGLFINELTRTAANNVTCADAYKNCGDALEGARLAFQLGLEGLSKDTMKALSDLRKALSDETAKLSDISRQFALAIAGSIFLGMGVILTKDSTKITPIGITFFGLVLVLYVTFVGYSGWQYIWLQRDLRNEWRKILYRFISDDEYYKMVTAPAERAEDSYRDACFIGGIAIAMLAVTMFLLFG